MTEAEFSKMMRFNNRRRCFVLTPSFGQFTPRKRKEIPPPPWNFSFLVAVSVYDGDAHCRPAILKSLDALMKISPRTDLLFLNDSESSSTRKDLRDFQYGGKHGFRNIEIHQIPTVKVCTYEEFLPDFWKFYPYGISGTRGLFQTDLRRSPKELYKMFTGFSKIIPKREYIRKLAIQRNYDFLFMLDSDLEVEPATLLKLYLLNCGGAGVLYEGRNIEGVVFYDPLAINLADWALCPLVEMPRELECDFDGRRFQPSIIYDPREYCRDNEISVSGDCGGAVLYRRDVLELSKFVRKDFAPLRILADDTAFFMGVFLTGRRDIKVTTDVKAIHHLSPAKKRDMQAFENYFNGKMTLQEYEKALGTSWA